MQYYSDLVLSALRFLNQDKIKLHVIKEDIVRVNIKQINKKLMALLLKTSGNSATLMLDLYSTSADTARVLFYNTT